MSQRMVWDGIPPQCLTKSAFPRLTHNFIPHAEFFQGLRM